MLKETIGIQPPLMYVVTPPRNCLSRLVDRLRPMSVSSGKSTIPSYTCPKCSASHEQLLLSTGGETTVQFCFACDHMWVLSGHIPDTEIEGIVRTFHIRFYNDKCTHCGKIGPVVRPPISMRIQRAQCSSCKKLWNSTVPPKVPGSPPDAERDAAEAALRAKYDIRTDDRGSDH